MLIRMVNGARVGVDESEWKCAKTLIDRNVILCLLAIEEIRSFPIVQFFSFHQSS